jgi:hypothetical protein
MNGASRAFAPVARQVVVDGHEMPVKKVTEAGAVWLTQVFPPSVVVIIAALDPL